MNTQLILSFLRNITVNNNRTWFQEHHDEYLAAKEEFEAYVANAIVRIAEFDPSIAHITVKDATYRFYRDTRFSPDKSPYKRHLGAYIAAHGKKAFHGGYYIHLEPDNCMLACGCYYLPTNILTACRNEIMANVEEWLGRVENPRFTQFFSPANGGGFGLEHLKTCPAGFPRDFEHIKYLRMKDYCCWHNVDEHFFDSEDSLEKMAEVFKAAKPMMDFVNAVIDDYE
jgi:uncharacterized protein (TIGR02453 family)